MEIRLFFEFLQVVIGNRETLSRELSDNEWQDIFSLLKKHALLGVGFTAVERLHTKGIVCPLKLRMQWYAFVMQIEKRNVQLNALCKKLTEKYGHDGLSACILKGQGNLLYYPDGLGVRRQSGDIDVWGAPLPKRGEAPLPPGGGCCNGADKDVGNAIAVQKGKNEVDYVEYHGHRAVREYVKMQYRLKGLNTKPKACYHHIDAPDMDGVEVEVHYRPTFCRSLIRNRRMQKWFASHTSECMDNRISEGFAMPTVSFNVVYQMAHLFEHCFEGGIGLRQMMDYYFTLRTWHEESTPVMSAKEVMAVLRSFGMRKFAGAVMYVLHEAFENEECLSELEMRNEKLGIERELKEMGPQADGEWSAITRNGQQLSKKYYAPWMICEPNEKEGRKLLAEIMQGGNFGQYDTRDAKLKKGGMMKHGVWKLKRVMRLVRSYPEEALWEPVFRVWHLLWRWING